MPDGKGSSKRIARANGQAKPATRRRYRNAQRRSPSVLVGLLLGCVLAAGTALFLANRDPASQPTSDKQHVTPSAPHASPDTPNATPDTLRETPVEVPPPPPPPPPPAPLPNFTLALDLIDAFKDAEKQNPFGGVHTRLVTHNYQGRPFRSIFQHAQGPNDPQSEIIYRNVKFPTIQGTEKLVLKFAAVQQGGGGDGVTFRVRVMDQTLCSEPLKNAEKDCSVDLGAFAGQTADLVLTVHPNQHNPHDGATWVHPKLIIDGRRPEAASSGTLKTPWRTEELLKQPTPDRIVHASEDDVSVTVVSTQDPFLDLNAQTVRHAGKGFACQVPLGPRMVVGEGPAPENHTLVKILNAYGMADLQFLAYPPDVRGGIQVGAGRLPSGATFIATAPLQSATRQIRLFNAQGGRLIHFDAPPSVAPPFALVVGDFLDPAGDEIALCGSASGSPIQDAQAERHALQRPRKLVFLDAQGKERAVLDLAAELTGPMQLSRKNGSPHDQLIAFSKQAGRACVIDASSGSSKVVAAAGKDGVYGTVFSPNRLLLTEPDAALSKITEVDSGKGTTVATRDAGRFENLFWVVTPPKNVKDSGGFHPPNEGLQNMDEGRFVRFCDYGHMRVDAGSPGYADPQFENSDPHWWAGKIDDPGPLTGMRPRMWEPCFTHRGFGRLLGKWEAVKDDVTGIAKYMMAGRTNVLDSYVEGDAKEGFHLTTYAFGLPAIDHLYLDRLGLFMRRLAPRFRETPERFPSLEPNHENEIPLNVDFTQGDYNPKMIEGFFLYLTSTYGRNLRHLNDQMGTYFYEYFDAPRWMDRGSWDDYGAQNPFFREWLNYNRYVINRRLAEGFREALLSGFPPEIIKSHQIPGIYFGGVLSFSDIKSRITPIDYTMIAGTGVGYTRYGVWYKGKHNFLQGSHSSGHDNVLIGEYNSLTKSDQAAIGQLKYMYDHGVVGIHVMGWREPRFNETMSAAVKALIEADRPRPGVTGGVGAIRAFRERERAFNIAVIGTGPDRNGLLKSLREDGSWEGTVSVVPFKAHVEVDTINEAKSVALAPGQVLETGPITKLFGGCQVELTFEASAAEPATIEYQVCHRDQPLPGLTKEVQLGKSIKSHRLVHRIHLPTHEINIRLVSRKGNVRIANYTACRHTERTAQVYCGIFEGQRHRGSVTFDVLE